MDSPPCSAGSCGGAATWPAGRPPALRGRPQETAEPRGLAPQRASVAVLDRTPAVHGVVGTA
eukprot:2346699-Lingulodinium_polyedra.AAC.1